MYCKLMFYYFLENFLANKVAFKSKKSTIFQVFLCKYFRKLTYNFEI